MYDVTVVLIWTYKICCTNCTALHSTVPHHTALYSTALYLVSSVHVRTRPYEVLYRPCPVRLSCSQEGCEVILKAGVYEREREWLRERVREGGGRESKREVGR